MLPTISVIGLGKLGACTAACFSARGFSVLGVDLNSQYVNNINKGIAPVLEPELQETINNSEGRLTATTKLADAIDKSDISFLIVPTPSCDNGHFSTQYLREALVQLSISLKNNAKPYHIFVITSTVSPSAIENELIPVIESYSGRKLNQGFGISYNPEFIALGSVIKNFFNPDMVLIGESESRVGDVVSFIYQKTCFNSPTIARMSLVSAEITKISLNAFVTMKISFANTLTNICENIPGANIDHITHALGADKRISPYYLKGGVSFGGPCFPRDNRAFYAFAKEFGVEAKLANAVDEINHYQVRHLIDLILMHRNNDPTRIGILGLSYKPNTGVIEESMGTKIVDYLLDLGGYEIFVFDPLAIENAKLKYGNKIKYANSTEDCVNKVDICVITNDDKFYKKHDFNQNKNASILIDCWRMLDPENLAKNIVYHALGLSCKKQIPEALDVLA